MKSLYKDDMLLTDEGVKIAFELDKIIRPVLEKYYDMDYNVHELADLIHTTVSSEKARMLIMNRPEKRKSENA